MKDGFEAAPPKNAENSTLSSDVMHKAVDKMISLAVGNTTFGGASVAQITLEIGKEGATIGSQIAESSNEGRDSQTIKKKD